MDSAAVLWRGMRSLRVTDAFMRRCAGGTELAPMSTTEELQVAATFSASAASLLFRFKVDSFMQCGADLQWLSAFPKEREVLFPPLTYLRPTGRVQLVEIPLDAPAATSATSAGQAAGAHGSTEAVPREREGGATVSFTVVEVIPHFPT